MPLRQIYDLRPLGIAAVPVLGRYDYRAAQPGLLDHTHPGVFEVCYLAKGQQMYRVGRRDFVLTGGDGFVTWPGEVHSTGEAPEEKGTLYWVQFRWPTRRQSFLGCNPTDGQLLVRQLRRLPHRHFACDTPIRHAFHELLLACAGRNDPLQRVTLQNRLLELLLGVIRCARQRPRASVSPAISDLLRYIETNRQQALPVPALAAHLNLSLPRFKARFKQEVGIPPAEYVLRRKIAAAHALLTMPGKTVTQVAMELNFCSSQHFATVFRRYTGRSPRLLRRSPAPDYRASQGKR